MSGAKDEHIKIRSLDDLEHLIDRIENGPTFAESFFFVDEKYFKALLDYLKIDIEEYKKKYCHFDASKNLHISDSAFDYTWISTFGLVAKGKATDNNYVNACMNQHVVVSLLFDKAIDVCEEEDIYDIDGFHFGYLSELTPALFNNILFYIEVFWKAYLSLSNIKVPRTHELSKLRAIVTNTMQDLNHDNSLFHIYVMTEFERIVDYIASISDSFKEHNVRYDDNPEDRTVIQFDRDALRGIRNIIMMSQDMISDYYYDNDNPMYLKTGLLQRLLDKAKTEEEREQIQYMYDYLGDGNS